MATTKIRGVTVEIGGDTSGLKKALSDVNKEISSTSKQLKDVERLLKLDPKNTELLRQKQKLLSGQIEETKTKLDALKKAEAELKSSGVDKNSDQFQALELEVIATEQDLKNLKTEFREFGSVAAQQIASVGKDMQDLGNKISDTGEKMTKTLTLPIVAAATAAVKTTADFDSAMAEVAATMGKSMSELESETGSVTLAWGEFNGTLREFAIEMGEKTAFSATEAAQALNYMALAGYDVQTSMEMLPNVLNLAAAGNIDLATASDMVTDVQTAFRISGDRTTQMVDEMAKAASTGNTSVKQLGEAFLSVGGLAAELNGGMVKLDDGTMKVVDGVQELEIALVAMANAGVKGSEAGNHMRNMLLKLSSPTADGTKQLEALGVKVFDTTGKMRSLRDIFGDLNSKLNNLTQEQKIQAIADLFNTRDLASAEALLNSIGSDWDEIGAAILKADGAAQKMADTKLDNLNGQITLLKSALTTLAISIGDIIMPYLRKLVEHIQGLVDKFNGLDDRTKKIITTVALVVAAAGPLLIIVGKVMSGIGSILTTIPKIVSSIRTVATAVTSLFSIVAANPIILVIAAIVAAVIAATILIIKNLDTIKAWIASFKGWASSVATSVATTFVNAFTYVRNAFASAFNALVNFFRGIMNNILATIEGVVNRAIYYINALIDVCNSVVGTIARLIGASYQVISNLSNMRLPRMASGGILNYGSAIVGEEGPELLTMMGNKAQITPITASLDQNSISAITGGKSSSETKVICEFTGSLSQLARVLQPVIRVESERVGASLINA